MKKIVVLLLSLMAVVSCIDGENYINGTLAASFEYDLGHGLDYEQAFGADSVFFDVNGGYGFGWEALMVFYHKVEEKDFKGGFLLSYLKPSGMGDKSDDHVVNPYRVVGKKLAIEKNTYAVFCQTDDSMMPERDVKFVEPKGICKPSLCWVNNTEEVYEAIQKNFEFGKDELKLIAKGYYNDRPTGQAEIKLAADTTMYEWTKFDISALGTIDAVDFTLECTNPDIPLNFCLDNFISKVEITY